jgi:hypothetical protein
MSDGVGSFRWGECNAADQLIRSHKLESQIWLTAQVTLANHTGFSATQIRQAQAVVNAHLKEIQDAWNQHFGG